LSVIGQAHAANRDAISAARAFEAALPMLQEAGDRWGQAECQWHYGLTLVELGQRERALDLLRAAVSYDQEIGHRDAADHAALLAHLAAGGDMSTERLPAAPQQALERAGS
jgi:hypothetical protein